MPTDYHGDGAPVVFIVDDDEAVRTSLQMLVRSAGLRSEAFASGQEFLEAYDGKTAGCVLLDLRMPGMSGLEVHAQLADMGDEIPVIFLTAQGEEEIPALSNAIVRIQKPFQGEYLIERLLQLMPASDDR